MNVQDLCDLLRERLVEELAGVQTGSSSSIPIPDEVKTEKFLADNIADVFKAVAKQEGTEAELIGGLEINAFLAAFQRAYEHESMSRMQRWAQIYDQKRVLTTDTDALKLQLPGIGVKVEDEFLTQVLLVTP